MDRIYKQDAYLMVSIVALIAAGCAADVEVDSTDDVAVQGAALGVCPPDVPPELAVPSGHRLAFVLDAAGQQLYACRDSGSGPAWVFQEPEADLYKPNGRVAGLHYVGPTWEALDGSTVVAARVAGFNADPTAIPWLLLSAVSHGGEGRMARVSYIQRLDTTAGLAPTAACTADNAGQVLGVDYTAAYYFYVPTGRN